MSPGNFPRKGILLKNVKTRPKPTKTMPKIMIILPNSCINEHITYGASYSESRCDTSYKCEFIHDIEDVMG
jgi:hypothetical protein